MALLYLSGEKFNVCERATTTTESPSANALFPASNGANGQPDIPFMFGSTASFHAIKFDIDVLGGKGALDTWVAGVADGWTEVNSGTGAISSSGFPRTGASGANFSPGASGIAEMYRDFEARAGESIKVSFWALRPAGVGSLNARIQNLDTGYYLQSTGAWQSSAADFVSGAGVTAGYVESTFTFTVQSFGGQNPDLPTLRLTFYSNTVNGNSYLDDVYVYPGVSFASVHGHNLAGPLTIRVQHSADNFVANATTMVTPTIIHPSFYGTFALTYSRWWRFCTPDVATPYVIPYFGELVLGQYQTAARSQNFGWRVEPAYDQTRTNSRGKQRVYSTRTQPQRRLSMDFRTTTAATYTELHDEWFVRSKGGHWPMVVVPYDSEDVVIYGRIEPSLSFARPFLNVRDTTVSVLEDPLPYVGA